MMTVTDLVIELTSVIKNLQAEKGGLTYRVDALKVMNTDAQKEILRLCSDLKDARDNLLSCHKTHEAYVLELEELRAVRDEFYRIDLIQRKQIRKLARENKLLNRRLDL